MATRKTSARITSQHNARHHGAVAGCALCILDSGDLITRLGIQDRNLVSASETPDGGVNIHVRPGAAMTDGQLAEAINATPGVAIACTHATTPPVFRVRLD